MICKFKKIIIFTIKYSFLAGLYSQRFREAFSSYLTSTFSDKESPISFQADVNNGQTFDTMTFSPNGDGYFFSRFCLSYE